jgi:hypothetical protein
MSTPVLGSYSFSNTPDVNGKLVLLNGGGNPQMSSGLLSARPSFGNTGNIYIATDAAAMYQDTGTSWILIGSVDPNQVFSGTGSITVPVGTTAQRPASPTFGMIRGNTDLGNYERYTTQWIPFGQVVQLITGNIPNQTGTAQIPYDNTTPSSSGGFQIWSQRFTPLLPDSTVMILFSLMLDNSTSNRTITTTVFRDTTLIGAASANVGTAGRPINTTISRTDNPGSVSTVTYSARLGANGSGTSYVNRGSTASLGGSGDSNYIIIEFK